MARCSGSPSGQLTQRLTAITPDSARVSQSRDCTAQPDRADSAGPSKAQAPIAEQRVLDPAQPGSELIYPLSSSNGAVIRLDDVGGSTRMEEIMIQSERCSAA